MYSQGVGFMEFQHAAHLAIGKTNITHVAVADIADFYPRIYTHRLENALFDATNKKEHVVAIRKLLAGWNETESHGIPVGSAPSRLLAEITINDVDEALRAHGIRHIRYSDDFRLFCTSKAEAFRHLAFLAQVLYENQGLTLQPKKTNIYPKTQFRRIYLSSPEDKELDKLHTQFEMVLNELGLDDPYEDIDYGDLTDEQKELVDSLNLQGLFLQEVKTEEPDISIIKFILRRLGQLGDNCLVEPIIENIDSIHPAFSDIVGYFRNLRYLAPSAKRELGKKLLHLIRNSLVSDLPFYRMWAFSLFTESAEWDNEHTFQRLLNASTDQFSRRELILAMGRARHKSWFQSQWRHLFDESPWPKRALLAGASCMAGDARNHWYRSVSPRLDVLEKAVVEWAKKKPFH